MINTSRSYLTAGVAVIGAGAIALTPVQTLPQHSAAPAVRDLGVELAATIDPITPWVDTFKLSFSNFQKLGALYGQQPLPLLNAVVKNQTTYLQELPDLSLITSQVFGNVRTLFSAPFSAGDPAGIFISDAPVTTIPVVGIPVSQQFIFAALPTILGDLYTTLEPVINFTASPISGALIGFAGPGLSSMVQMAESVTAVVDYIKAGEVTNALNELINIPAKVVNAGLNGGKYLDLTPLAQSVLPPEVTKIGLNLGGVLTPVPTAEDGVYSGGVAFDALSAQVSYKISNLPPPNGTSVVVDDPGLPVGMVGSLIGLGQNLGTALTLPKPTASSAAATPAVEAAAPAADAVADTPAPVQTAPAPKKPTLVAPAIGTAMGTAVGKAIDAVAPNKGRSAAGSADSGNETAHGASARGMAKSAAARGAR